MWEIPCPLMKNYLTLDRSKTINCTTEVILTHISEEDETFIDNMGKDSVLTLERGKRTFNVTPNQIYCYGEVDFNNNDDLVQIEHFNFITKELAGYRIPANYNYDTHSAKSPNKKSCLYTETWSSSLLTKYAHGCLGKPDRILLFYQRYK